MVLSLDLDMGRPHSWDWPALAPLPRSDHCQLLSPSWDPPPAQGLLPNTVPQGLTTTTWLGYRAASQSPQICWRQLVAIHVACESHGKTTGDLVYQAGLSPGWEEPSVRLLAGWKTGKWEHKQRMKLWSNVQSRLSFSLESDYWNPMWGTGCTSLAYDSYSGDLTISKEPRINWWLLLSSSS